MNYDFKKSLWRLVDGIFGYIEHADKILVKK